MFEYAAVFEGEVADALYVFFLSFLEDVVVDSQGFQQNDGLPIQKASLILVPVQNVQILACRFVSAVVFDHALSQMH